jgi:hypothetical protein
MTLFNSGNITRRKLVKGAAGTALCCAYLPLEVLADSAGTPEHDNQVKEKVKMTGASKEGLAAACGTYCGACPAYLARHGEDEPLRIALQKRSSSGLAKAQKGIPPSNWMDGLLCDGCLSGGVLAGHCQRCDIRVHALNKQEDSRCTACEELPCYRIADLVNMGRYLHRQEYLPNLKKVREMGVQAWVKKEEERWRCPKCSLPLSWYDAACARCGEPRSRQLFPLT